MTRELAIIAAALLAVAGISRRLTGTPATPAMAFVLIGLLVGPLALDAMTRGASSSEVRGIAEAALTIVLFGDASRVKLRALRREYSVPLRLLGIGLPLTVVFGALAAALLLGGLDKVEAAVLAIVLAPTDAALAAAVVTEPRLPSRVRQGLNVESGLNDGICVPLLLIALSAAEVEDHATKAHAATTVVAEAIGFGIVGGVVAGLAAAGVVAFSHPRRLIAGAWLQVVPLAGAGLAYGVAQALGGSGFIAAFLAGSIFGRLLSTESEEASRLNEELGDLLAGVAFLLFGAVLLGPALEQVGWQAALYAVLSLTIVRMLPVAIAMLGSGARRPTLGFLGWFGPRGLASIVFAVIVLEEAHLRGLHTILEATYLTVGLSVLAHGLTGAPLARRYAAWYRSHPEAPPQMESVPAVVSRTRGERTAA